VFEAQQTVMANPRRPRRTRDPAQAREDILLAAHARFSRCGYRGARISDVADDAGCSEALVYFHFKSKAELFREVVTAIDSETRWFDDTTREGLVRSMHDGELHYHRDARWRALDHVWSEALGGEKDLLDLMRPQLKQAVERLNGVLGKFDPADSPKRDLMAKLLLAVSYGSRVLRRYDPETLSPEEAAELLGFATDTALQTLAAPLTPADDGG
jgi:AcrR family transcriptional regulator